MEKREKEDRKKIFLLYLFDEVKIVLLIWFDTLTITQREKREEEMTSIRGNKSLSDSLLPLQPFRIETIFKYELKKKKRKEKREITGE